MFLTTHAAAGIFIANHFGHPFAVFGLSFLSHFVLDFIPHGDESLYRDREWKVEKRYRHVLYYNAIDFAVLVGLTLWAYTYSPPGDTSLMLLGVFGAVVPDFLSYLFPVIHERFSWLFFIRWLYAATKPTGLRYIVRAQNWLHQVLHHEIIRRDVPFRYGLALQVILVISMLSLTQ